MGRILVVEDMPDTREQLRAALREVFPDIEIDVAANVTEALRKIWRSEEDGRPYQIVLLDFRLPEGEESTIEVIDTRICEEFRRVVPNGMVLHFTAHSDNPEVKAHMKKVHSQKAAEGPAPMADLIQKTVGPQWIRQMVDTMEPWVDQIRKERIEASFERLFVHSAVRAGDRGVTHELAAFKRDAETFWEILPDELKKRIGRFFLRQKTENGSPSLMLVPQRLRGEG